ncbi:MAG: urease accessory UreF family protein [Pseudomonadota bacterium]
MSGGEVIDAAALARLAAWFSPACPVGAFSYSHGLERLCEDGALANRQDAETAIALALTDGSGRTDAILLAETWRAQTDGRSVEPLRQLSLALAPTAERWQESVRQGNAFAAVIDGAWPLGVPLAGRGDLPYPVAVGLAGAGHGVPLRPLVHGFLMAFAANLISAAVRLVPLGQTDGQRLTARLSDLADTLTQEACAADLDDIGGAALGLDLASMRHECQEVRLYRS